MDTIEKNIDNFINNAVNNSDDNDKINREYINMMVPETETINNKSHLQLDPHGIDVFNAAMEQYLRIDEEIKLLLDAIRTRNKMKRQLATTISNFLKENKIQKVKLDGNYKGKRIENKIYETTTGFRKENVVSAIHEELQENEEMFDRVMTALQKVSVLKQVCKLRIVNDKPERIIKNNVQEKKKKINPIDNASILLNQNIDDNC
jgi:hypothetical protein